MKKKSGIVYVMSNPAILEMVKIGKTKNLTTRIRSLYSAGVPLPFRCVYAKQVEDMDYVEDKLHNAFASHRVNEKREFFRILKDELIHFFDLIPGIDCTPDKEIFDTKEDGVAFEKASKLSERFNFGLVALPTGTVLNFIKDENITCKIVSKTEVEFKGETHSLSSAGVLAIKQCGYEWKQLEGPRFWKFEGETMHERRQRMEDDN